MGADRVVVKVDTVDPVVWRRMNRPAPQLRLGRILSGIEAIRSAYEGRFETESVLVPGLNDGVKAMGALADFVSALAPAAAWVLVKEARP